MSPFLLQLALLGSRRSWGRPLGIVGGVAIGMAMFLLMLGAYRALDVRETRGASIFAGERLAENTIVALTPDTVLMARVQDYVYGQVIHRIDLAATPDSVLYVPGIDTPPVPGTYYASPALAALIDSLPADELGERFGKRIGILGAQALQSPDSLIAVIGADPQILFATRLARLVTTFDVPGSGADVIYQIVIGIGAIGLFFPVVLFIFIVTRLGVAERRERFATLRLIGASAATVIRLAALETLFTSTIGAALGVVLAVALQPIAALIPINGGAFYPADLAVDPLTTVLAAAAMVTVATGATAIGIRRAGITPLGASRALAEARPRGRRALVLVAGLVMLALPLLAMRLAPSGDLGLLEAAAVLLPLLMIGGFFCIVLGIVLVGPWLIFRLSGVFARLAQGPAGVIAASRIRATSMATFRSVSGLVIAVFMVSVFAGAASGVLKDTTVADIAGKAPRDLLVANLGPADADALVAVSRAQAGVNGVVVAYDDFDFVDDVEGSVVVVAAADALSLGLPVPQDTDFIAFNRSEYMDGTTGNTAASAGTTLRAGTEPAPQMLFIRTDGSAQTIERVRTALIAASGATVFPSTRAENTELGDRRQIRELAFVAYLGAFVSVAIAGLSLAIATASAMIDRKRPLGLMRLMGMPVRQLRRIVGLEAAVPLVAVLAVSIALGLFVAWLILKTLSSDIDFTVPEPAYFATLAVGMALALAAVAATFGLVSRSTAVEATRFE